MDLDFKIWRGALSINSNVVHYDQDQGTTDQSHTLKKKYFFVSQLTSSFEQRCVQSKGLRLNCREICQILSDLLELQVQICQICQICQFPQFKKTEDGRMDGPTNQPMDGPTDGQTLLQRCRDASKNGQTRSIVKNNYQYGCIIFFIISASKF